MSHILNKKKRKKKLRTENDIPKIPFKNSRNYFDLYSSHDYTLQC